MPRNPLKKEYWADVVDGFKPATSPAFENEKESTTFVTELTSKTDSAFPLSSKDSPGINQTTNDITSSDRFRRNEDTEQEDINNTNLSKDLSVRHLLTLAVGGAIGTGLYVNTGAALSTGGPASLVIDWVIISTCLLL